MFGALERRRNGVSPLVRLERDFEGLVERLFGDNESRWFGWTKFTPTVNVAETETAYEVTVELPGMKPEDFNVEWSQGELWISGQKQEEREESGKTFHRVERSSGEFRRMIPLPGAVADVEIAAHFNAGVLTLNVPKSPEAKPRKIEVNATP